MNLNSSYLTHWTLAVVTAWFLMTTIIGFRAEPGRVRPLDFLGEFCLLTGETALSMSVVVVLLYWLMLYTPGMFTSQSQLYANVFYHGLTLVFMLIDFAIGRLTFAWRHYFYTVLYGVVYLLINLAYTLGAGIPVYDVRTSGFCGGAELVVTVA